MPKEKTKAAPKKRGRKPKPNTNVEKPPPKKRGRKPKGGKIIKKTRIILHLVAAVQVQDHQNTH